MAHPSDHRDGTLPGREEVLAYLKDSETPASVSDLARAFGLKGKDRTALRMLLRELQDEGLIDEPHRRRFASRERLPSTTVLQIIGPDSDGELRAKPVRWPEDKAPPVIFVAPLRSRAGAPGPGERILARLKKNDDGTFDAFILRLLGAVPTEILGVFHKADGHGRIQPTDRRAKSDYGVPAARSKDAEPGELVRAKVLGGRSGGLPQAEVVERLGSLESPGAIGMVALHSNGIPMTFPAEVVETAGAATPAGVEGRRDLRKLPMVTIDDEDARDFDDAVFAEPDDSPANAGGWRIKVAIADVAWYVRPASPLDNEAYRRGNSVYLPDRVVPMLPEALSNGLCSLKPDEPRAVLIAHMQIDRDGNLIDHRFERALIRSSARLTYRIVQAVHDGVAAGLEALPEGFDPAHIRHLYGAYTALDAARARRGTLELELPELKVNIQEGCIESITPRVRLDAHRLIEEFMITANVAAAETLEKHRAPCMYRVHEPPDAARLESLRDFLESFGLNLPGGEIARAGQLAGLLERAADDPSSQVIHEAILRCQSKAVYSPQNVGHFGLALKRYAHFTSPIRRYADLLVHRSLINALNLGAGGLAKDDLEERGLHISDTERRAQAAEREALDRYLALYLQDRIGSRFEGRIAGVTRFGLFVRLNGLGADGLVPMSLLGDERFDHDEDAHALIGRSSNRVYRLGDGVEVELREAEPVTGGLIMSVLKHMPIPRKAISPARKGKGTGPKRGKGKGRPRGKTASKHGRSPGAAKRKPSRPGQSAAKSGRKPAKGG